MLMALVEASAGSQAGDRSHTEDLRHGNQAKEGCFSDLQLGFESRV